MKKVKDIVLNELTEFPKGGVSFPTTPRGGYLNEIANVTPLASKICKSGDTVTVLHIETKTSYIGKVIGSQKFLGKHFPLVRVQGFGKGESYMASDDPNETHHKFLIKGRVKLD